MALRRLSHSSFFHAATDCANVANLEWLSSSDTLRKLTFWAPFASVNLKGSNSPVMGIKSGYTVWSPSLQSGCFGGEVSCLFCVLESRAVSAAPWIHVTGINSNTSPVNRAGLWLNRTKLIISSLTELKHKNTPKYIRVFLMGNKSNACLRAESDGCHSGWLSRLVAADTTVLKKIRCTAMAFQIEKQHTVSHFTS